MRNVLVVGGVWPLPDLKGSYVLRDGQSLPVDLYALILLRDLDADRPVESATSRVLGGTDRARHREASLSRFSGNPA